MSKINESCNQDQRRGDNITFPINRSSISDSKAVSRKTIGLEADFIFTLAATGCDGERNTADTQRLDSLSWPRHQ